MRNKRIEAEGQELVLRNGNGDVIIVPKNKRKRALNFIKAGNHKGIDRMASKLPSKASYAEEGSVVGGDNPFKAMEKDPAVRQMAQEAMISKQNELMGEINPDNRNVVQRGIDASTSTFKEAVPESFRNVLPIVSDADDVAYFAESASKGDYLGMGMAGIGLLPFVKGKWLRKGAEKYSKKIEKYTAEYMKKSIDPENLKRAEELEKFNTKKTGFARDIDKNKRLNTLYTSEGKVKKGENFEVNVITAKNRKSEFKGSYTSGEGYDPFGQHIKGIEKIEIKEGLSDKDLKKAVGHENKHAKTKALIGDAQGQEIADSFYSPGEIISSGNFSDDAVKDYSYITQGKEFDTFIGTNLKDELVDNKIIKSVHDKVTEKNLFDYANKVNDKTKNTFVRYLPYIKDFKKFRSAMNRTYYTAAGMYAGSKLLNKPSKNKSDTNTPK